MFYATTITNATVIHCIIQKDIDFRPAFAMTKNNRKACAF